MSLERIEQLAKQHAANRNLLAERVRALQDEMETIKRRKLPGIKSALSDAKDSQLQLRAEIDGARVLFDKPKSRVFHGIKLGVRKATGKLTFDDAPTVVKLIRKHLADQFKVLVKVTEKPVKKALSMLTADQLKKIGCSVADTSDEVFAEPVDSEIDKMVDALLKDKSDEEQEDET